jgi:hypothetical protein
MQHANLVSVLAGQTHEPRSVKRIVAVKRVTAMSPTRPGAVLLTVIAVAIASALLMGVERAAAQTLTNPNPPAKWAAPRAAAKPHTTAQTKKSCKEFGAGFVNVAGTDTCVKIGGFVTVEGGARAR